MWRTVELTNLRKRTSSEKWKDCVFEEKSKEETFLESIQKELFEIILLYKNILSQMTTLMKVYLKNAHNL